MNLSFEPQFTRASLQCQSILVLFYFFANHTQTIKKGKTKTSEITMHPWTHLVLTMKYDKFLIHVHTCKIQTLAKI